MDATVVLLVAAAFGMYEPRWGFAALFILCAVSLFIVRVLGK